MADCGSCGDCAGCFSCTDCGDCGDCADCFDCADCTDCCDCGDCCQCGDCFQCGDCCNSCFDCCKCEQFCHSFRDCCVCTCLQGLYDSVCDSLWCLVCCTPSPSTRTEMYNYTAGDRVTDLQAPTQTRYQDTVTNQPNRDEKHYHMSGYPSEPPPEYNSVVTQPQSIQNE